MAVRCSAIGDGRTAVGVLCARGINAFDVVLESSMGDPLLQAVDELTEVCEIACSAQRPASAAFLGSIIIGKALTGSACGGVPQSSVS
jgi:hypothetical protein